MLRHAACVAVVAVVFSPDPGHGQDWRDMTSFRQRSDETQLDVAVRYGAGKLVIEPGTGGELYRVGLRYDSDLFDPITEYRAGRLKVGVEGVGKGIRLRNHQSGELKLAISRDVPLHVDLEFGAVEADIELGGLRIRTLNIETGASDTSLRFSAPNLIACDRFDVSMGAAGFRASGLGNANCSRLRVEGGVGDITLDFGGRWQRDIEADITMALGSVTLVIPEDIGVRVERSTFLTDFNPGGFEKRDNVYYSTNWERAARRLMVDLEGAFGSINVRWSSAAVTTP